MVSASRPEAPVQPRPTPRALVGVAAVLLGTFTSDPQLAPD